MMKLLRAVVFFMIALFGWPNSASAQNCLEVETILVNACDDGFNNPEGLNEMFRFRVSDTTFIGDITIVNGWPSEQINGLPFNGFVQNAQTAAKTTELNATITEGCGYLLEPFEGIIIPGRSVLAVTSFQVSAALNSFANLTDTLYIIYHQHTGEGGGHFLNFNAAAVPQDQTLRIQVNGPNPCYEEVTYIRGSLVDVNGNNTDQNGAFVDFAPDGTPTYGNTGCQAPFEPFSAEWTNPGTFCETNAPINLTDYITGTQGGTFTGTGVTGTTFNPAGLSGPIDITYTVVPTNECETTPASVTHTINVFPSVDATFTNPGETCASVGVIDLNSLLTGTPGGTWSGSGVSGSTINVGAVSGTITVTYSIGSGTCTDTESQTFEVINLNTPFVSAQTVYCNGETPEVWQASGAPNATINWFSDAALTTQVGTGPSFTPVADVTTTYYVNQTQAGCSSDSLAIAVEFSVVEVPTGDTLYQYCVTNTIPTATVSGSGTISWYTEESLSSVLSNSTQYTISTESDTLYVTSTVGSCESEPLMVVVMRMDSVFAAITPLNGTSLCPGNPLELTSNATDLNEWNTGSEAQSISVEVAGTYTLTREGFCNTATDEIEITGLPVTADFTTDVDSGYTILPVYVTDMSINAETCTWTLNDSAFVFDAPGTISFPDSGTYNLQVICTNSTGCADTSSRIIKVKSDKLSLVVPNVFSPNGDNLNELFKVKHNAVKTFSARVYNRWGKLLATWENVNDGWDGTFSGEKMADGTYFYVINGTDIKDQPFEEKGVVTLMGN